MVTEQEYANQAHAVAVLREQIHQAHERGEQATVDRLWPEYVEADEERNRMAIELNKEAMYAHPPSFNVN